jgi:cell shape-determining protein MreD
MIYFLSFFLILSVFLEGTATTLPLVFVCLLCLTVLMRGPAMFFLAFIAGIFLDSFALRPIGQTSIFFLIVIFLILLYQRKYEINSYPFVFIASCIGAMLYLVIFGYTNIVLQAFLSALFAMIIFSFSRIVTLKSHDETLHFTK